MYVRNSVSVEVKQGRLLQELPGFPFHEHGNEWQSSWGSCERGMKKQSIWLHIAIMWTERVHNAGLGRSLCLAGGLSSDLQHSCQKLDVTHIWISTELAGGNESTLAQVVIKQGFASSCLPLPASTIFHPVSFCCWLPKCLVMTCTLKCSSLIDDFCCVLQGTCSFAILASVTVDREDCWYL